MPEVMNRDHFPERYLPTIRLPPITAMGTSSGEYKCSSKLQNASVPEGQNSLPCRPHLSDSSNISRELSPRASSVLSSMDNFRSPRLSPCPSGPNSPHLSPRASPRHSPRAAHSHCLTPLPSGVTTYKVPTHPGVLVSPGGPSNKTERLHTRYLERRVTWLNNLAVADGPCKTSPRRPKQRQLNAQEEDSQEQRDQHIQEEEEDRYWTSMSTEAQLAMRQCRGEELGLQ